MLFLGLKYALVLAATLCSFVVLREPLKLVGMRFFRDLGRVKAQRRLYAGSHNALTIRFIVGLEPKRNLTFVQNEVVVDVLELKEADGQDAKPIWLSIRGRVYDVSSGRKFYGPAGSYHVMAAKDATRAFCTGCLRPECLIPHLDGLTSNQIREADRWLEYFEFHDKYKYIGKLGNTSGEIEALVDIALETEESNDFVPVKPPTAEEE